ncbi:MAG: hypothetical protein IKU31_05030, partial [Oscillospiraceae bacterium]|nr:hypothetical protein [Oscillospiraceae bacterium]
FFGLTEELAEESHDNYFLSCKNTMRFGMRSGGYAFSEKKGSKVGKIFCCFAVLVPLENFGIPFLIDLHTYHKNTQLFIICQ